MRKIRRTSVDADRGRRVEEVWRIERGKVLLRPGETREGREAASAQSLLGVATRREEVLPLPMESHRTTMCYSEA